MSETVKGLVTRPRGSKDKTLTIGMRLYVGKDGSFVARKRAPHKGAMHVGVLESSPNGDMIAVIELTTGFGTFGKARR